MQLQIKPEKRTQIWLLISMAISSVLEIFKYTNERPLIDLSWFSVGIWSLALGCLAALIWYNAQAQYHDNPGRVIIKLVIGVSFIDCILLASLAYLIGPWPGMLLMIIQSAVVFLGLVYYSIKLFVRKPFPRC